MFIVYDIECTFDERVCRTSQEVRDFILGADLTRSHFIVVEFDTGEGRCRDVSDIFETEMFLFEEAERPEYPANDRAASAADRRHQFTREAA